VLRLNLEQSVTLV